MQTYYLFQSGSAPDLRCFTDEASGSKLPAEDGPWALVRKIDPEDEMPHDVSRKIVAVAVRENGFFLAGESNLQLQRSFPQRLSLKVIASRARPFSIEMAIRSARSNDC